MFIQDDFIYEVTEGTIITKIEYEYPIYKVEADTYWITFKRNDKSFELTDSEGVIVSKNIESAIIKALAKRFAPGK